MIKPAADLAARVWQWLPARTDSRRVTLPSTIAAGLEAPVRDVSAALMAMEARGHVVRDRSVGVSGWHRGTPPPALAVVQADAPTQQDPTLFDEVET